MRHILIGSIFILISGCANMNSKFDCPIKDGLMCKSLDEVNSMVDSGRLGNKVSIPTEEPILTSNVKLEATDTVPSPSAELPKTLRQNERVMRIWIAPYIATDDNYYQSTWVYSVIKQSRWHEAAPILK